jgi:hypothetical protein
MFRDNPKLRTSYQPSHLEYADWGEFLGYLFTRLYTPQNVISFFNFSTLSTIENERLDPPNMIE